MKPFVKIRAGIFSHQMPPGPFMVFIYALFHQRKDGTVKLKFRQMARDLNRSICFVNSAMQWLKENPKEPHLKVQHPYLLPIDHMEKSCYLIRQAEWYGEILPSEEKLIWKSDQVCSENQIKSDLKIRSSCSENQITTIYVSDLKELREEPPIVPQNPRKEKAMAKCTIDRPTPQEVIDAWNEMAALRNAITKGKGFGSCWKSSKGMDEDRKKVTAAVKKNEFCRLWRVHLDRLKNEGIPWVDDGTSNWKPEIQWFVRDRTRQMIENNEYWDLRRPGKKRPVFDPERLLRGQE